MQKGEKRKQELLQIAYRLFLEKGYENTSVEAIISAAKIAKGTYYYHFQSKEQMLEEVIGMMLEKESALAGAILASSLPIPQKIAGIIAAFHPGQEEMTIEDALNRPENLRMHDRIQRRLRAIIVPMLAEVTREGISAGLFHCDHISERVNMLMILSSALFDEGQHTPEDVAVFIDAAEKILGAEQGAMAFIGQLIGPAHGAKEEHA